MFSWTRFLSAWTVGLVVMALLSGCAQNTRAPFEQQVTPVTSTEQEAATQGSSVNIWVLNAPGALGTPATPLTDVATEGTGVAPLLAQIDRQEGQYGSSSAGYTQGGISITVTTGGTAPALTGTTSATASPAGTQAVYPVQEVRPDIGISAPIGIAPGGIVDQAASATGGEGSSEIDKTSQQELRYAQIKGMLDRLGELMPLLEQLLRDETPENVEETHGPGD